MNAFGSLPNPPVKTPLIVRDHVLIKDEGYQLSGSVKYRMVYQKVMAALTDGSIHENSVLLEMTAGSTGVALAYIADELGLRVEIYAYESICPAKKECIESLGGHLVLFPDDVPIETMMTALKTREQAVGCWHLNQYDRASVIDAYQPLAEEILRQICSLEMGHPHWLYCPVGSGGLIQGLGAYFRHVCPDLKIAAVEPRSGVGIDGIRNTRDCHMGGSDPYDLTFPDITLYAEAPDRSLCLSGEYMGASSSATFTLASEAPAHSVLMIAADHV